MFSYQRFIAKQDIVPSHRALRRYYIVPHIQWVAGRFGPVAVWRVSRFFAENTGLVVGQTLVDPSGWRVPVLVSNFGQETVMVEPFSEIGMIAQVSAIQPVMDQRSRTSCDPSMLPDHLQRLLDLTSQDLDNFQRGQLAGTLLQFVDLFPVPGSALTGHTDAVEHTIDTGNSAPIRCAPRHVASQD